MENSNLTLADLPAGTEIKVKDEFIGTFPKGASYGTVTTHTELATPTMVVDFGGVIGERMVHPREVSIIKKI